MEKIFNYESLVNDFEKQNNNILQKLNEVDKKTFYECLEADIETQKELKLKADLKKADLEKAYLKKQSNNNLKNLSKKHIQAIYNEYSNLQTICEEKIQKKLKIIPQLIFINDRENPPAEIRPGFNNQKFIILNLEKYKSFILPKSKFFKEAIIHELSHAIHFQNNYHLSQYYNGIKCCTRYNLKIAFSEGFATHIAGRSYTMHTKALDSIKQFELTF